jgi:succinoglycan biosynthesis transport protein ExoP
VLAAPFPENLSRAPELPMAAERLMLSLRARWRLVLATWLGTIAAVSLLSLALPPHYKATASILVERNTADPIAGVALPPGVMSNYLATQVDIVKSEDVALRAVRALGLQEEPQWLERWKSATGGRGNFDSWLAGQLLKKLDVSAARDSTVLNLSHNSSDAAFSSAAANAIAQAYIAATLRMRLEPAREYNAFFDERARPLRNALDEAQARLSAYQQKQGLIATDERMDIDNARLTELNYQVIDMEDALAGAKGRQRQAAASPRNMQEVLNDPVVASLTAELARQEARATELRSHLGDQHPELIDLRAGIVELRNKTDAAIQRASGTLGVSLNVTQGRLTEMRAALERQRTKVLQQKRQRDAAGLILREVESAQRAYDAVLARASQTALESRNTQSNVSVLKVATPPPLPAWPRIELNAAVAAVLGLLLAAGLALVKEARDRRLRTVQDVVVLLRQPFLLALPDSGAGSRAASEQTQARLVRAVPKLAAY